MLELKKPSEHPIKAILQDREITQQEVALALGVSQSTLSQILAGWRRASPKIQKTLDDLLKELTGKCKAKAA